MSLPSYITKSAVLTAFFALLGKIPHSGLIRQMVYLKVENQILRSKAPKRITTTAAEKRRLIKYGRPLGGDIKHTISIVSYSTFRRWINNGGGKKEFNTGPGRPKRRTAEIVELVVRLAKENAWGYTRIMGELKKLNIVRLSRNTVRTILRENGIDPCPKRGEDTWDAFIKRHFETLWACDFFTKTVWAAIGRKTIHALFFINIRTRKVYIAGMTQRPTKEWVLKQAKNLSGLFENDKTAKLIIRDGDAKYPKKFDCIFEQYNAKVKKIPRRSPNLNPYAEGWVGTIKRECLNHFIVFGRKHLKYLVKEYVKYYNSKRPHSAMDNLPLDYRTAKTKGKIQCESRLGGLIKHYYRSG